MISEEKLQDRLLAIFLNDDVVQTHGLVSVTYKRAFNSSPEELEALKTAMWHLVKDDVLIEYDIESEVLDAALVEHSEHGQLANSELSYIGVDEVIAIGPKFPFLLHERASEVAEQAVDGGLNQALSYIRTLPIDSRSWTGLPSDLVFDERVKDKVLTLLRQADEEIGRSTDNNAQISQARAFIKAATVLAEAPRPQTDLIWEIIQRLAALIGITQGIQGLFNLFRPAS